MFGTFPFNPKYRCLNFCPCGNDFITPVENGIYAFVRGIGRYVPTAVRLKFGPMLGGVGFGFFQSPNNRAMLLGAPRKRSGAAGGLQATTRVFGQGLGTALTALAFHASTTHGAILGIMVGVMLALAALVINVLRYFSPVPDAEL
ncbi:hypothetical protein ECAE60S_03145 [Eoetvoesiella caeni]